MKQFSMEKPRQSETIPPAEDVLGEIRRRGNPKTLSGISRFGIETSRAFGVSVPQLRDLAKKTGRSHELAQHLWKTGIHEARILASMIDDPAEVTEDQMEKWAKEFDSWDVVDGSCGNLFDKTPFAVRKAHEWSVRPEEYVKRAGFVLMAELAVHDKKAADRTFLEFLPVIVGASLDERNFVKKAVNWALRQIGKRNMALNKAAIRTAKTIEKLDSGSAKWIAADALRELKSPQVRSKLNSP
ncbi:MAG TPA: DNA alkylation repair protein [Candidatus Angelobacter sp.]|nr:DNA alkylation repair protein [Candidatus Angelobacter sp.]